MHQRNMIGPYFGSAPIHFSTINKPQGDDGKGHPTALTFQYRRGSNIILHVMVSQ